MFEGPNVQSDLPSNAMEQVDSLYAHYHKLWWCHTQHYHHFKCKVTLFNALALIITAIGIITGKIFHKTVIVVCLTTAATLVKGWTDFKKFHVKMDMTRFAYTTYAKTLAELERIARGRTFDINEFLIKMTTLDDVVTDFAPLVPTHIVDKYLDNFKYVPYTLRTKP